jgi:hypothetical protein
MKVKLFLRLIMDHAVKTCGGVKVQLKVFLTLVLDTGKWLTLRVSRSWRHSVQDCEVRKTNVHGKS